MGNMVLKKIYFPTELLERLDDLKDKSGIAVSEHIRQAVYKYLEINQPGKVLVESKPGRGKV